jgi:hypothetical protein
MQKSIKKNFKSWAKNLLPRSIVSNMFTKFWGISLWILLGKILIKFYVILSGWIYFLKQNWSPAIYLLIYVILKIHSAFLTYLLIKFCPSLWKFMNVQSFGSVLGERRDIPHVTHYSSLYIHVSLTGTCPCENGRCVKPGCVEQRPSGPFWPIWCACSAVPGV